LNRHCQFFSGLSRKKRLFSLGSYQSAAFLRRATSQSLNPEQDFCKQLPADCHLGHLKRNVPAVSDNLRADLYQFRKQSAQRPVPDFPWQNQPAKKVDQVVGQDK